MLDGVAGVDEILGRFELDERECVHDPASLETEHSDSFEMPVQAEDVAATMNLSLLGHASSRAGSGTRETRR